MEHIREFGLAVRSFFRDDPLMAWACVASATNLGFQVAWALVTR